MRFIGCVYDTGTDSSLVQADVLEPSWLSNIRQCTLPVIQSAADNKLKLSGTITLQLRTDTSCVPVTFDVIKGLGVPVRLKNIHRRMYQIDPYGRNGSGSPPLPAGTHPSDTRFTEWRQEELGSSTSDVREEEKENQALLVTLIRSKPDHIMFSYCGFKINVWYIIINLQTSGWTNRHVFS